MIRRMALAILFVPVLLVALSLLGLLFGAIGTVIHIALRDQTEIRSFAFRVLVFLSLVAVSLVGTVRILNWSLVLARGLGRRYPRLRQVASDSLLAIVGFGGIVGVTFLTLAALGAFPIQRIPFLITGGILTAAAGSILVPRFRRAKKQSPTPGGRPPSGAVAVGIPRAPESTDAQAGRVARRGVV